MKEPLRVLQVVNQMVLAGAETMIMNLYEEINRDRVQFDFVVHSRKPGAYDKRIKALGGKIYYMPKYNLLNHTYYRLAWRTFLKKHPEITIIHGHLRSTANIYLAEAKKFNKLTIAHSHNTSNGVGFRAKVKAYLQKNIPQFTDVFIGCSTEAGQWLFGQEVATKNNFFVLNNGIHLRRFKYDRENKFKKLRQYNLSEDHIIIGHIGRFNPQKNHHKVIEIAQEIIENNDKARLFLIGEGTLEKEIKELVRSKKLEKYIIFVSNANDIEAYYSMFDLLLMPSLFEGLPLTLIEAQANGLPCLISDTITEDLDITDLITRLSINEPSELWAKKAINRLRSDSVLKEGYLKQLAKAGYDVSENAKWLSKMYLNGFCNE